MKEEKILKDKIKNIEDRLEKIYDFSNESKFNMGILNFIAKNKYLSLVFGLCIEFVSGGVVGFAIGYVLDLLLGTSPILIIVFFIIGFFAGFLNLYRYLNKNLLKQENKEC